ncbi:MarR family winged helix-turn-helix transcriptional regulator, partial [Arcobacteraceae bacterium]|nr:MarR family winged helix-turn-helix transcriptional regulator [Arcobacteraceae bacterium]
YDITAEQRQIILILNAYGSMSQRRLCELSMSEPSNLTITLKRMGKNDYIKKIKDPKDKRASLIEATQKACSLNDVLKEAGNIYKDTALKGIDQKKVDIAREVLEQMHENILKEEHQNLLQQKTKHALEVLHD